MTKTSTGMNWGKGLNRGLLLQSQISRTGDVFSCKVPAYTMSRLLVMLGLLVTALCQKKTPRSAGRGFERA